MRTITAAQLRELEDLSAEGLLRNLPLQTAEKDIHVTDLLKGLSDLKVYHDLFQDRARHEPLRHDDGIKLIFAGGTCLSKAHGLIGRMSEDIDIKVILEPRALRKQRGLRARLVALHNTLPGLFEALGYPLLPSIDHGHNPRIRDQHRYYVVGAGYEPSQTGFAALRPELRLELIERTPLLPLERRSFGYLHERIAQRTPTVEVTIDCVSVAETAAEKVVSLLRRCAYKWDGHQKKGDIDPALVRHVYDVAAIATKAPDALTAAAQVFAQIVDGDCREFKGQNPEFDHEPFTVLQRTLETARTHPDLVDRYETQLLPLVYDDRPPSYREAFDTFEAVARTFVAEARRGPKAAKGMAAAGR